MTEAYTVQNDETGEKLAVFHTYEAAHYEAYGIWQTSGEKTVVLRGDVRIWDVRNGFHEQ